MISSSSSFIEYIFREILFTYYYSTDLRTLGCCYTYQTSQLNSQLYMYKDSLSRFIVIFFKQVNLEIMEYFVKAHILVT